MIEPTVTEEKSVSVAEFCRLADPSIGIDVVAGRGGLEDRYISSDRVQKLGLALAGFNDYVRPGRIQMIGNNEIKFLEKMNSEEREAAFRKLDLQKIPCVLVTKGLEPPLELKQIADDINVPVLTTQMVSSQVINITTELLRERLAREITIHGVLMEMGGIGVLITGESGIGKSESALDLITRGHRLVADDAVRVKRIGSSLFGASPKLTFEHLEIRGLGIVNVRELFGVAAVCEDIPIDLFIEFQRWDDAAAIDRIGLEQLEQKLLGISRRKFALPVRPGRNIATLVETAVKIFLTQNAGFNAAADMLLKHSEAVGSNSNS